MTLPGLLASCPSQGGDIKVSTLSYVSSPYLKSHLFIFVCTLHWFLNKNYFYLQVISLNQSCHTTAGLHYIFLDLQAMLFTLSHSEMLKVMFI